MKNTFTRHPWIFFIGIFFFSIKDLPLPPLPPPPPDPAPAASPSLKPT